MRHPPPPRVLALGLAAVALGASLSGLGHGEAGSTSAQAAASWLDPRWEYRTKFTVAGAKIAGNGTYRDFPLLLRFDAEQAGIFLKARPDAGDVVITAGDGITPLSRQIVSWDPVVQTAEVWFRAAQLSKTVREFFLYYGNPDTMLAEHDGMVWLQEYLGVYHFAEDPSLGLLRDHGPFAHHAVVGAGSNFASDDRVAGAVGQGWRFNGSTQWLDGDAIQSADSSFTISAWFSCWDQDEEANFAFSVEQGFWHLSAKQNDIHRYPDFVRAAASFGWQPESLPDTLLHHYVWAMDGVADTIRFYYDGVEQQVIRRTGSQRVYTGQQILGHVGIAGPLFGNTNPLDLMEGITDEFRVQSGVRNSGWIAMEYSNMANPAAFWVFGPEEKAGTPVRLLSFTAERHDGQAVLRWILADPGAELLGFHVYRGESAQGLEQLTAAPLYGSHVLAFIDPEPPQSRASYWLAEILQSGELLWHGPAVLGAAAARQRLFLAQNSPNPFGRRTRIDFQLLDAGPAQLQVFDAAGRSVARLVSGPMAAGAHHIDWDARDDQGRRVPAGVYFYRLENARAAVTRKLMVNR